MTRTPVDEGQAREFLGLRRLAVVGVSPDPAQFGNVVYRALRDHGNDVVPVHPAGLPVDGDPCYTDLASVDGDVDGVVVMVPPNRAMGVVRQCAQRGIRRVWLFRGVGSPGAVSPDVLALCRHHGIDAIPGACPLMFLEPVDLVHRVHHAVRRLRRDVVKGSA